MKQVTAPVLIALFLLAGSNAANAQQISDRQRANLLRRFPAADTNKDGKLSDQEIRAYARQRAGRRGGVPKTFKVDPGWKADRFPEHAVCYRTPKEIAEIYTRSLGAAKQNRRAKPITSYEKPTDGSLRIVGTGHSFMAPGYKAFPLITRAAGLKQPPLVTHTGGGMTGSARYKWEQENGIFQFDRKPVPKLLASIANAKWDVMMWGPYYQDQPEYYACWIEFCLKYNPDMKFYLADAWPQLEQFKEAPESEDEMTYEAVRKLGEERNRNTAALVNSLNQQFPNRVFVLPTSDAMVLAVREYHQGNLPGIEGVHKVVGGKDRSLWRDRLGHLGPGLGNLEGYVFYATVYQRSPELIANDLPGSGFPGTELDRAFRRIAWEAVSNHPLSGVKKPATAPAEVD